MDRRRFLKRASGLFIACAPAIIRPDRALAQLSGGAGGFPGPGTAHSASSEATVLFGASNVQGKRASGINSPNLVVAADANRVLLAFLSFDNVVPTGVTVFWDPAGTNQAMTQVCAINNGSNAAAQVWGLVAPTAGTLPAVASWTGGANVFIELAYFKNVNQSTPFPNTNTGTASSTINVTSAANRIVAGCIASISNPVGMTDTQLYYDSSAGTLIFAGSNYGTGSASKSIGTTSASSLLAYTDLKGS